MERKLYEASLSGNVHTLNTLIQEDRLILDRVTVASFNENPLHIAALYGHLDFTRTLISLYPNLASELDSCGRSPLHLASDKGHVDIVRELLRARSTDVCLHRDKDGMIPLHLAVMKGRVGVIEVLIQAEPDSIKVRLDRGETVLHLCVRYNGLEALKLLVESVHGEELVNSKDDDGNTILHVAAAFKQMEIVKHLLSRRDVKENANALNGNGFTALDVLENCPRDLRGVEIRDFLLEAGVQRAPKIRATLIQEDRLILDGVTVASFNENPLHIAALRGHLDFTRTLISLNPNLASELDSCGRSPLHLASDKGHVDIVQELLRARSTDVCFCHDKDGMIPLHLAVMKGRVRVIQELIQAEPDSIMVRLDRGETVLHLCVRYNGLEALKLLMESVQGKELVNSIDDNGNTILHVAAAFKQMEIVKHLLSRTDVKENANALNGNGFTALDVLENCPEDLRGTEIRDFLLEAGVQRASKNLKTLPSQTPPPQNIAQGFLSKVWKLYIEADGNWLEEARGNLIMAATVTATLAFQAGINPPGGFWQDAKDEIQAGMNPAASPPQDNEDHRLPGYSILASEFPTPHSVFLACNTVSLVASLSIILLMISGFPLKNKLSVWLLMVAMTITVSSILFTYLITLLMTVPNSEWTGWNGVGIICTLAMYCLVMLLHIFRILIWLVIKLKNFVLWLVPRLPKDVVLRLVPNLASRAKNKSAHPSV